LTPAKNLEQAFQKSSLTKSENSKILQTHTMPRQRSRKLSNSHKAEQESAPELRRDEEEEKSDNESLGMLGKDSDEEQLDRLVLGDDSGFMAQLGPEMEVDEDGEADCGEGTSEADDEEKESGGLEGVDDADASTHLNSFPDQTNCPQAFLSRLWAI
jgi:hypothetical protein